MIVEIYATAGSGHEEATVVKAAVVGAGDSGKAIKRALEATGAQVTLHSRRTGFDVLRDDGTAALSGADVIVEATGRFTTSKKVATEFFTRSTRAVSAAANALGARHVLLSIVNCDLPEVQGYGYFAGKCAQERLAQDLSKRMSLVRSTQWFEFAEQNMERMRYGPVSLVPSMRMRPVSLDSVAETVARAALSETDGQTYQVAGPEVMTLWEMTAQLPSLVARPVPLVVPTGWGLAFRRGALVPGDDVPAAGPTYAQWLQERRHPGQSLQTKIIPTHPNTSSAHRTIY